MAEQFVEEEARHRGAVGGVGELLLFDEGVFVEPVQELRAVGADHAGLRIMDVRVDQAGQHQLAGMVVDRRVFRRAAKNLARLADGGDQPVFDRQCAVVDQPPGARAGEARIIAEGENAAANDP